MVCLALGWGECKMADAAVAATIDLNSGCNWITPTDKQKRRPKGRLLIGKLRIRPHKATADLVSAFQFQK